MKLNDLSGRRFGKLAVVRYHPGPNRKGRWQCQCDCGKTAMVSASHLSGDVTTSCGCNRLLKANDLSGQRFGRLVAVERAANSGTGTTSKSRWKCICDCGGTSEVYASALRGYLTKSCGCIRHENAQSVGRRGGPNYRHGQSNSRTWRIWSSMIQRCSDPNHKSFPAYGGRGILVCERWKTFENFFEDMGEIPDGLTIDRIEVDNGYQPGNCRWATWEEQANNKRRSVLITAFGESLSMSQWARRTGLAKSSIMYRLARGMTAEETLTTPPRADLPRHRAFRPAGP
jgi:hypothetical protein